MAPRRHAPYAKMKTASGVCASLTREGAVALSPAALKVLFAVARLARRDGRPVTFRQVCDGLGHCKTSFFVHNCLVRLRSLGLIRQEPGLARTIRPNFTFTPAGR